MRERERERDHTLTRIISKSSEMEGLEIILEGKWAKKRQEEKEKKSSRWENSMSKGQEQEYSLNVISSSHSQKTAMALNYSLNIIKTSNYRLQSFYLSFALDSPTNTLVRHIKLIYSTQNLYSPSTISAISTASKALSLRHQTCSACTSKWFKFKPFCLWLSSLATLGSDLLIYKISHVSVFMLHCAFILACI